MSSYVLILVIVEDGLVPILCASESQVYNLS